jgi:DNA polymerase-4
VPQAILLPIDFVRYRTYSRRFKEVILSLAPVMEDRGVDEVYRLHGGARRPGGRPRWRRASSRPSCRPNKLLAKMASEFNRAVSPSCSRRIWSS